LHEAVDQMKTAVTIFEALAAEPDDTRQIDLALSLGYLGDLQGNPQALNIGDTAAALETFRKELSVANAMVVRNPANERGHIEVIRARERMGDVLSEREEQGQALEQYQAVLTEQEMVC